MNANTMLTAIQSNAITTIESVNNAFIGIAETLARGESNSKELAKKFYELYNNPERDKAFLEMGMYELQKSGDKKALDFKKVVDNVFMGMYSGNTAYKYTQCFKYFCNRDEWNSLNMGKMIILSPLMNDKAKNDGYSLDKFYFNVGCEFYRPTLQAHDEWMKRNETALATITALESTGNTELANKQREMLESEPVIMGFIYDETAEKLVYDVAMCADKGAELVPDMSDKELKTRVSEWVKAHTSKASKDGDKASKDGGKADKASSVKSIAELKADALAAMLAYTGKLETVPKALVKAIDELQKEGEING